MLNLSQVLIMNKPNLQLLGFIEKKIMISTSNKAMIFFLSSFWKKSCYSIFVIQSSKISSVIVKKNQSGQYPNVMKFCGPCFIPGTRTEFMANLVTAQGNEE